MIRVGNSDDPYCSVEQLIEILRQRGLGITGESQARFFLKTVGHHRLTPYYHAYHSNESKIFHTGVSFSHVHALYSLERRLRLLILGPLEKIEVSLRSLIITAMGSITAESSDSPVIELFNIKFYRLNKRNGHFYDEVKESAVRQVKRKQKFLARSNGHKGHNIEAVIKQLDQLPPWFIMQCLSFGDLSKLFCILQPRLASEVCEFFDLTRTVMEGTLRSFTGLRNACAHHDTIFNMHFDNTKFPYKYRDDAKVSGEGAGTLYERCAMIHIMLRVLSEKSTWYRRLKKLFNEYDCIDIIKMGFPEDWQTMPFWCTSDVREIDQIKKLRMRSSG